MSDTRPRPPPQLGLLFHASPSLAFPRSYGEGRREKPPYDRESLRSVCYVLGRETFKLAQVCPLCPFRLFSLDRPPPARARPPFSYKVYHTETNDRALIFLSIAIVATAILSCFVLVKSNQLKCVCARACATDRSCARLAPFCSRGLACVLASLLFPILPVLFKSRCTHAHGVPVCVGLYRNDMKPRGCGCAYALFAYQKRTCEALNWYTIRMYTCCLWSLSGTALFALVHTAIVLYL